MSTLPKTFLTPEQYLEIDSAADFKSEYFDGEMFAMAGARLFHNLIVANVIGALHAQLRGQPCRVLASDQRVRIDATRYAYPDVTVVCGKPEHQDGRFDVLLNPTVIVEVLSRSTESHDRNFKRDAYTAIASLRQYVLVSSLHPSIEVFTRTPDGAWVATQAFRDEDSVALDSVGCRLTISDAYAAVDFAAAETA